MAIKVGIGKRRKAVVEGENSTTRKYKRVKVPTKLDYDLDITFGDLLRTIEKVFPELSTTDRERWDILMNEIGYVSRESVVSICKSSGMKSLDDFIGLTDRMARAEKGKLKP